MKTQRSFAMRLASIFFTFMLLIGLVAAPSFAADKRDADKRDRYTPTPNIMEATEDVAGSSPRSMEEIQARQKGGLNGVQGTADYDKMKKDSQPGKPDNVFARKIDKALDNLSN